MTRIVCMLVIVLGMSVGCGNPKYPVGTYVKHKLDGRVGIVTYRAGWMDGDYYRVRFSGFQEKTDTHIIEPDGAITKSPYADVPCKEFELESAEQPKLQSERKQ